MADNSLETVSRKFIHDIRTPLSVIQMLSDLFTSTPPSAEDIDIMKQEVEKASVMVTQYSEAVKKFYS